MAAFGYGATNQIRENIRALFRRVKAVSKIPLTHEEFSSLFIPAEHREMYRDMSMLSRTGESKTTMFQWSGTKLLFRMNDLHGKHPLPIPRDLVLQHDAPPELVERITTWIKSGGDASGDFGRVKALFEHLNHNLSKGQIRFVWPSILAILGESPILSDVLQDLQDVKIPTKAPVLLPGLLQACRKTAASISTASLIPADVEELEDGEGSIEMVDAQQYDEQGLGEFYGIS